MVIVLIAGKYTLLTVILVVTHGLAAVLDNGFFEDILVANVLFLDQIVMLVLVLVRMIMLMLVFILLELLASRPSNAETAYMVLVRHD